MKKFAKIKNVTENILYLIPEDSVHYIRCDEDTFYLHLVEEKCKYAHNPLALNRDDFAEIITVFHPNLFKIECEDADYFIKRSSINYVRGKSIFIKNSEKCIRLFFVKDNENIKNMYDFFQVTDSYYDEKGRLKDALFNAGKG